MSYIYSREKPGCTCPRCRFAAANSQLRRMSSEPEAESNEEKRDITPLLSFTQLEKNAQTARRPLTDKDAPDLFLPVGVAPDIKNTDIKTTKADVISSVTADGSMESFDGAVPEGWSTDMLDLVSREDRRGRVHTGRYSVSMRDGAQLSFVSNRTGETGYELSFFAKGTGRRTGLSATLYCLSEEGEREYASLFIQKGDLPGGRGQFGYYVQRAVSLPTDAISLRVEFTASASWGQSVLLDDVALK